MEIVVNCERCGKEERITQKFLGNARKQGDKDDRDREEGDG